MEKAYPKYGLVLRNTKGEITWQTTTRVNGKKVRARTLDMFDAADQAIQARNSGLLAAVWPEFSDRQRAYLLAKGRGRPEAAL